MKCFPSRCASGILASRFAAVREGRSATPKAVTTLVSKRDHQQNSGSNSGRELLEPSAVRGWREDVVTGSSFALGSARDANILITGANRGIGLALTRRFLELGQRVFAGLRKLENQSVFADLPAEQRARLTAVGLDVGSDDSVREAFGQVSSQVARLDVLVNMAGVSPFPHDARLDTVDLARCVTPSRPTWSVRCASLERSCRCCARRPALSGRLVWST